MIDRRCVFEIHQLKDAGCSDRQIARQLGIGRTTVGKYLDHPEKTVSRRKPRASKLDAYRKKIDAFLEKSPDVNAPVVLQRLKQEGFDGEITIVRSYLREKHGQQGRNREAFIRFESSPGKQMQIDWGHFGSLTYGQPYENFTPWPLSKHTAGCFMSNLPTARGRMPFIRD